VWVAPGAKVMALLQAGVRNRNHTLGDTQWNRQLCDRSTRKTSGQVSPAVQVPSATLVVLMPRWRQMSSRSVPRPPCSWAVPRRDGSCAQFLPPVAVSRIKARW
jgi:hypothetical protein